MRVCVHGKQMFASESQEKYIFSGQKPWEVFLVSFWLGKYGLGENLNVMRWAVSSYTVQRLCSSLHKTFLHSVFWFCKLMGNPAGTEMAKKKKMGFWAGGQGQALRTTWHICVEKLIGVGKATLTDIHISLSYFALVRPRTPFNQGFPRQLLAEIRASFP